MGGLRSLPPEFDPAVVAAIDGRLDAVERDEGVRILLAIESGSRAWGFPSPDSDYDCRFLYVRPRDDYLSLWPRRDVIETPLDAVLDVNGWDLGKALRLVVKGNAVVLEWLQSPITYRGDAGVRAELLAFAKDAADRSAVARHYLHLGVRQYPTYFAQDKQVSVKKAFYALRPAVALRWLRLRPDRSVAPMHFPTLMAESDVDAQLAAVVADLLARKAVTRELGRAPLPAAIRHFIEREFAIAEGGFTEPAPATSARHAAADALFRRLL